MSVVLHLFTLNLSTSLNPIHLLSRLYCIVTFFCGFTLLFPICMNQLLIDLHTKNQIIISCISLLVQQCTINERFPFSVLNMFQCLHRTKYDITKAQIIYVQSTNNQMSSNENHADENFCINSSAKTLCLQSLLENPAVVSAS